MRTLLSICVSVWAGTSLAQQVPANFFVEDVVGGFDNPVGIEFGPNVWLWVVEQDGPVWIATPDGLGGYDRLPQPFLDLTDEVNGVSDRGLLGLALHPDWVDNGYVYVLFTVDRDEQEPDDSGNSHTYSRLERWTADPGQAMQVVDPARRVVLVGAIPGQGFPACHS